MITDLFINMFIVLLKAFFGLFPVVSQLPFGTDEYVIYAVSMFKGFANIFPPISAIFSTFLIYLGFRVGLLLWTIIPWFGKMVNPHKKA
jgi:hypothetical protein